MLAGLPVTYKPVMLPKQTPSWAQFCKTTYEKSSGQGHWQDYIIAMKGYSILVYMVYEHCLTQTWKYKSYIPSVQNFPNGIPV